MKPDSASSRASAKPEDAQAAPASQPRLWLSALADGDTDAAQQACAQWRDDPDARRTWHAYHLIGDVLRSDELARPPTRDAAFLAGLRGRLAQEPTLLAPEPAQHGPRWLVPAAAAAGFVMVAGVLVVLRMSSADGQAGWPALAGASRPGAVLVSTDALPATSGAAGTAGVAGGVVLRDRRLDEFLRAHQAQRSGVAVAAPGGALRQVEAVVPAGAAR